MISLRCGCRWATSSTFGRKFAAIIAMGRPARSAAGHSQSTVPSVGHLLCSGPMKVKRQPSMPGRCFHVSTSARLSGLSSGKLPRIANRPGCARTASMQSSLAFGSHGVWGVRMAASTPPASISFKASSLR